MKNIEKIQSILGTDYKGTSDEYESIIDDLLIHVEGLEEQITDLENENHELGMNQKEFNPYDEYGVSERDFV